MRINDDFHEDFEKQIMIFESLKNKRKLGTFKRRAVKLVCLAMSTGGVEIPEDVMDDPGFGKGPVQGRNDCGFMVMRTSSFLAAGRSVTTSSFSSADVSTYFR